MNYRFSALITKEDAWYVARCPELGVTSQGKDVESARANLREAIELYLETWGAPDGRSAELPSSGLLSKFPPDMPKLPSVSGDRVVKALKRAAFVQLRQKGSHVSLEKRLGDQTWKTVVPMHSEVAKGALADILKQSGLTLAEFLDFL